MIRWRISVNTIPANYTCVPDREPRVTSERNYRRSEAITVGNLVEQNVTWTTAVQLPPAPTVRDLIYSTREMMKTNGRRIRGRRGKERWFGFAIHLEHGLVSVLALVNYLGNSGVSYSENSQPKANMKSRYYLWFNERLTLYFEYSKENASCFFDIEVKEPTNLTGTRHTGNITTLIWIMRERETSKKTDTENHHGYFLSIRVRRMFGKTSSYGKK